MQALEGTYAGIFHFLEWTEQIKNAARRYLSRTAYAQLAFVPKKAQ